MSSVNTVIDFYFFISFFNIVIFCINIIVSTIIAAFINIIIMVNNKFLIASPKLTWWLKLNLGLKVFNFNLKFYLILLYYVYYKIFVLWDCFFRVRYFLFTFEFIFVYFENVFPLYTFNYKFNLSFDLFSPFRSFSWLAIKTF